MRRRSIQIALAFCALASSAEAGDITATASQGFVHVEIVTCNQMNPDQCPLVYNGPMSAGQTITTNTGRICYKRENYPGDASSGMEASWQCHSNPSESPETSSID